MLKTATAEYVPKYTLASPLPTHTRTYARTHVHTYTHTYGFKILKYIGMHNCMLKAVKKTTKTGSFTCYCGNTGMEQIPK